MFLIRLVLGLTLVIMIAIFLIFPLDKTSEAGGSKSIDMVPNIVVIKFKAGLNIGNNKLQTGNIALNALLTKHGVISLRQVVKKSRISKSNVNIYDISNIYYANFSGDQSPATVAAILEASPLIEYAEPKYIHHIAAIPNDSLYHLQKAYYNIIKMPQAWDIVKGQDGTAIIAIVDGGTDIRHQDLADNIWMNEAEVNGTEGVDDDGNGYTDDLYGWNFAKESGDPSGFLYHNGNHGTLTAGIASAISDNKTGVAGVSWNATIMAINASHKEADWKIRYGIDGIIYAAKNGADVISCSWGGYDIYSKTAQDFIQYANSLGAVVIAAAGNDSTDQPFYPAYYKNVLSVAGTDTNDIKWEGSNYGSHIDLAAPAESIYYPLAGDKYGFASATSLSAPLVAGVAGLVKAQNPGWTGVQAGEQVRVTADEILSYAGELGRGRLNAYRAVTENSPSIHFVKYDYLDENDNRFIEPGERIEVYITLINYLAMANNIKITLSTSSDYLTMIDNETSLSSLGMLEEITLSDPFVFDVAENTPGNPLIKFDIQIEADGYEDKDRFTFERVSTKIIWTRDANNPVMSGGARGTWNKNVFMPSVLYNPDSSRYEMWFSAFMGPNSDWSVRPYRIGFAHSPDGINWTKHPTPVLEPDPGTWDEATVEMSMVIREEGQYKMWYTGWTGNIAGAGIGYATSPDGIKWTKWPGNPVMTAGSDAWEAGGNAYCSVMPVQGGGYKMWYSGWHVDLTIYKDSKGYATSVDGITWIKADSVNPVLTPGSSGQWDDCRISGGGPIVFLIDNVYNMWYMSSGNSRETYDTPCQLGWATSDDGVHWNKYNNPNTTETLYSKSDPVLSPDPDQWDDTSIQTGTIIPEGDSLRMWYTGFNRYPFDSSLFRIGHATLDMKMPSYIEKSGFVHIPDKYILRQNYPNPFNPRTIINYELPMMNDVEINIYNLLGQKVATLVSEQQRAGNHQVEWDASHFSSGIYYYRIEAGEFQDVKKMILLR